MVRRGLAKCDGPARKGGGEQSVLAAAFNSTQFHHALMAEGPGEADGSFGACNAAQSDAHQRCNEHDERPIAVNASRRETQKLDPDEQSRESKDGCSKRKADQSCEQDNQ
jgi:hypothetical protein